MRIRYISVLVVLLVLFSVLTASAATGTLDSPGPPESTYSYTLEDIYNRLNDGTEGTPSTFTEPASGPTVGTGHTLSETMAIAPPIDNTNGATQTHVLTGMTVWGLTSGQWGLITGTMPNNGAVTIVPTMTNQTIAVGYHNGSGTVAGDADLVASNIRNGVNIFGVSGDPNVVNTSSGNATAADIAAGKIAWVDGSQLTGTARRFTDNGDGTVTDNHNGLIWLKNANCFGALILDDVWAPLYDLSDGVCGLTDGSGDGDWRLPSIWEFYTLVDTRRSHPPLPAGHPFTGVQWNGWYWSGTIKSPGTTNKMYVLTMTWGDVYERDETGEFYVWPIRDEDY